MDEVAKERSFFDAPAFLDGVEPVIMGFGGPILILLLFIAINKTKLKTGALILIVLLLYVFSILTGVALFDLAGDRSSSFIAAFWAPVFYSLLVTGFVQLFYRPPEIGGADYDHLID